MASEKETRRVGRFFTASEFGTTDVGHLPGLGALCAVFLDPMRAKFGTATIHSGYRSASKNTAVGGAKLSKHLYDETPLDAAADVTFASGTPSEWGKFAREIAFVVQRGGVGVYRSHVHVDLGSRRTW